VYRWQKLDEKFKIQFSDARKAQAEAIADSIVDIADEVELGRDQLAKAKLRIDARKWLVGRLAAERSIEERDENGPLAAKWASPRLSVEISGLPESKTK